MELMEGVYAGSFITIILAMVIGRKNHLAYWLYGSGNSFVIAICVGALFWLSWAPSYFGGPFDIFGIRLPESLITGFIILCTLLAALSLYTQTASEFAHGSKFQLWIVYFGQILFAIFAIAIVVLYIFSKMNQKKKEGN